MTDIEFIDGLSAKPPHDNAPEYVKAKLSIKREALIAFLQKRNDEWLNAEVKEAKSGKWYVAVDAWKPNSDSTQGGSTRQSESRPQQRQERQSSQPAQHADASNGFVDDESIPFAPIPRRQLW